MWGVNYSALLYTSRLLFFLVLAASGLYVGLIVALNTVEMLSTRYGSVNSLTTLLRWNMRNAKVKRLVNRWAPSVGMFIVGYILGQSGIFNPVRELHNVEVLRTIDPRNFVAFIPATGNPMYHSDSVENLKLCPYGDPLTTKPGVVFPVFQYKQEKDCLLIDVQTEVKYLNNADMDVVDKQGHILFAKE